VSRRYLNASTTQRLTFVTRGDDDPDVVAAGRVTMRSASVLVMI
jgi:hypothetical protein